MRHHVTLSARFELAGHVLCCYVCSKSPVDMIYFFRYLGFPLRAVTSTPEHFHQEYMLTGMR